MLRPAFVSPCLMRKRRAGRAIYLMTRFVLANAVYFVTAVQYSRHAWPVTRVVQPISTASAVVACSSVLAAAGVAASRRNGQNPQRGSERKHKEEGRKQ